MFEFITNKQERGQVGIGTLIVFIAMVLVAAIAAGVLINTAGFLQSQAEATGEESTDLVSERIDVTSTVGIVGADDELAEIRVGVAGAPGADQIDLSETTIQAVGPEGQANLVMADEDDDFDGTLDDADDATDLEDGVFGVQDSEGDFTDEAVLDGDASLTIVLNPEEEPFGDGSDEVFGAGQTASLEIVSPSSATTSVDLRTPDLLGDENEASASKHRPTTTPEHISFGARYRIP